MLLMIMVMVIMVIMINTVLMIMIMIIRKDGVVGVELTCSVVPGEQALFILFIQKNLKIGHPANFAKGNIRSVTKGFER